VKVQVVRKNRSVFEFQNGQIAREDIPISGKYECLVKFFLEFEKHRSPVKID